MGFQTQRQPVEFQIVFQLGLRDLGVGISLMLLRSVAPLSRIQRSLSSYLLLLWKTKMRKDTNLQKKVYCNIQHFHFRRYFRQQSSSKAESNKLVESHLFLVPVINPFWLVRVRF